MTSKPPAVSPAEAKPTKIKIEVEIDYLNRMWMYGPEGRFFVLNVTTEFRNMLESSTQTTDRAAALAVKLFQIERDLKDTQTIYHDWGKVMEARMQLQDIVRDLEADASRLAQDMVAEAVKARTELTGLRLILAADLGNIKAPIVSRTKREILEETIARIETVLAILSPTKNTAPTEAEES